MADTRAILATAATLIVVCGGCGQPALPVRVRGIVIKPQWPGVGNHADVEYRCSTPDCDSSIHVEIDV